MFRLGPQEEEEENNNNSEGILTQELLDRYLVAVLYFSLNGDKWSKDLPFLQHETHVCEWWTHRTVNDDDGDNRRAGGWNDSNGTIGVTECEEEETGNTMVPTAISLGTIHNAAMGP